MATCGSLRCLFQNTLPESPSPKRLTSWNQIDPIKPIELSSFTEMFGELYLKEAPESPRSIIPHENPPCKIEENKSSDSFLVPDFFTPLNSESLHLCTEGLGSESSDEVENSSEVNDGWRNHEKVDESKHSPGNVDRNFRNCIHVMGAGSGSIRSGATRSFPPPISCIGRSGKPYFSFRSYRHDGRFVLREIKVPNYEFLHALREDGRLRLHLVPPPEEFTADAKGHQEEQEEYGDDDDDDVDANEKRNNDGEEEKKSTSTAEICKGNESPNCVICN